MERINQISLLPDFATIFGLGKGKVHNFWALIFLICKRIYLIRSGWELSTGCFIKVFRHSIWNLFSSLFTSSLMKSYSSILIQNHVRNFTNLGCSLERQLFWIPGVCPEQDEELLTVFKWPPRGSITQKK